MSNARYATYLLSSCGGFLALVLGVTAYEYFYAIADADAVHQAVDAIKDSYDCEEVRLAAIDALLDDTITLYEVHSIKQAAAAAQTKREKGRMSQAIHDAYKRIGNEQR